MAWKPWETKDPEKEPTLEGSEEGTKEGEPEGKKKTESSSDPPPTPTGVESPFSSGPLAGMTAQEAADRIALQELTITEQRGAVAAVVDAPPVAAPEPEPEPVKISSEDFFLDPAESIRKVTSETIQAQLKEIVAPLEAQLAKGFVKDSWTEAGEQLPNLSAMRPMIEAVLKQRGITNPDASTIIGAHDLAVGQAQRKGVPIPGMETKTEPTPTPTPTRKNERMIPQHSPSTQPLASTEKKEEIEPLDENEARVAREQNMTPEQFRQWQAIDGEDVLAPASEKAS